jgi:hypothetical protein
MTAGALFDISLRRPAAAVARGGARAVLADERAAAVDRRQERVQANRPSD